MPKALAFALDLAHETSITWERESDAVGSLLEGTKAIYWLSLRFPGDEPWKVEHGWWGRSVTAAVAILDAAPLPAYCTETDVIGDCEAL